MNFKESNDFDNIIMFYVMFYIFGDNIIKSYIIIRNFRKKRSPKNFSVQIFVDHDDNGRQREWG